MSGHTHLPIPLPQNKIIILEMFKDKCNKLVKEVKKSNWLEKFINSALCQATTTLQSHLPPLLPPKKRQVQR